MMLNMMIQKALVMRITQPINFNSDVIYQPQARD
jgi:hypothetical protein